ncbi:MAG: hypothetical protein KZQ95_14580 [Candidatus Thiodiazotropha sp. (ex Epidulcina cf. delphinae)]|nr:hypothetical protein [Candidatus Thiodiazotropha sp. (ex Epidulcina cf. delphinae)]
MQNSEYSNKKSKDDGEGHPKGNPLLIIMVIVICVTVSLVFSSSVSQGDDTPAGATGEPIKKATEWQPPQAPVVSLPAPVDAEKAKAIADDWGIELISLRLAAAGYMIDFRFRVLDEKKAGIFFDHRIKPHLVVERSNAKLPVPMAAKVGAFRATNRGKNIKPNRTYYMVFGNPDAHVKSGEKVTMVIGDFKAEHLIVN